MLRRMAGDAGNLGVGDELDRIGAARVLGDRRCRRSRRRAVRRRAPTFSSTVPKRMRLEDLGLLFRRQVDALGVAAPFDVEDAVVAPAVLVVADQLALADRPRASSCRCREAEEQRRASGLPVGRRRAVHREHAVLGHQVVHDREDALLHLAGVLGAEDDELAVLEAEVDAGRRGHAGGAAVGGKRAGVVDREVGLAEVASSSGVGRMSMLCMNSA